jgi:hypothetical protein
MVIRPEKSYVATNVEVNGHTYTRQRIDAEISKRLRPGYEEVSPTCVRTHTCSDGCGAHVLLF